MHEDQDNAVTALQSHQCFIWIILALKFSFIYPFIYLEITTNETLISRALKETFVERMQKMLASFA